MSLFKCPSCGGTSFSSQNILVDNASIPVIVCVKCGNVIGCSDFALIKDISERLSRIEEKMNEPNPISENERLKMTLDEMRRFK